MRASTVRRDAQSIGDDPKTAAKCQKASNEDKDAKLTYRARNQKGQASWSMETPPPSSWSLGVRYWGGGVFAGGGGGRHHHVSSSSVLGVDVVVSGKICRVVIRT